MDSKTVSINLPDKTSRIILESFTSATLLAKAAASSWIADLLNEYGFVKPAPFKYTVALSGGRITKTFFNELVSQIKTGSAELQSAIIPGLHFFWADERCVPPTDPENNYLLAKELLFDPLGIKPGQIHRIRGEAPEPEALANAIQELTQTAKLNEGKPVFDMIFLGMGEDGHTASLFPGESEEVIADPAIFRAVTAVKPPPRRITLGYSTINAARNVWVLASGKGKEESFARSINPLQTPGTPLGRILKARRYSKVLTDIG